jgi:hypothetical protein
MGRSVVAVVMRLWVALGRDGRRMGDGERLARLLRDGPHLPCNDGDECCSQRQFTQYYHASINNIHMYWLHSNATARNGIYNGNAVTAADGCIMVSAGGVFDLDDVSSS